MEGESTQIDEDRKEERFRRGWWDVACSLVVEKDIALANQKERGQKKRERNEWGRKEGDKSIELSVG